MDTNTNDNTQVQDSAINYRAEREKKERQSHRSQTPNDRKPRPGGGKSKAKIWLGITAIALLAIGLGVCVWLLIGKGAENEAVKAEDEITQAEREQIELQQKLAQAELENADRDLMQLENQRDLIVNDTLKARLTQKYEAARVEIEKLQQQLRDSKAKSKAEIERLNAEINTLRELLKHYLEEIARLNKENEELRAENQQVKEENRQLSSQVSETTARNQVLSERMTLAEKINVTGVNLTALNKKGKSEKKVKKATQLLVTFTIPQNNSTPVGNKTIYLRLISPEGNLLGGAGSFNFEGASVACSAKKVIEYEGAEIAGIPVYVDVPAGLTPGEYTVELFADGYRLASRRFSLN